MARERRWRDREREERTSARSWLVAGVVAALVLMVIDSTGAPSPVEPVRRVVGEVVGPAESVTAAAIRPFTSVPSWLRSHSSLERELAGARADNATLRSELRQVDFRRNRLEQYEALTTAADQLGYALVPARVVAYGAASSFSRTVTIDAGSRAGLRPDQTVLNGDGLVGRVVRVNADTATVVLICDADSVVGGRVGESMELGFVKGTDELFEAATLDFELVDSARVPAQGDVVVTWGSARGAPYGSGIPVGTVRSVFQSLRDSSQRAEINPFVDFSSLDVVGVVVPSGTRGDRAIVEADGKLR